MKKIIGLFPRLEIETQSTCNRHCNTCLRNSIPDRNSVASWFEVNKLPADTIKRILEQSIELGFKGEVCLSHYNEPLMDERIIDIVKQTKSMGFSRVFFCSNGDFLTEEIASGLDGALDDIGFTLYMKEPMKSKREVWIRSLFKKTRLDPIGIGIEGHMATHHSPLIDVASVSRKHSGNPCSLPTRRLIINHKGQMLLCCDDLTGNFDLGNIHESTVEELWYSDKHQNYVTELLRPGGRSIHPHCLTCPRK